MIDGLYWEEHGSGPPLILSAGLGGSGNYWLPNLSALAERHRVILYDHRGTGRSDRALPDEVSIDTMADDVFALMAALDIPTREACFVGHAIGGLIGLEIALRTGLKKLVIVNGWVEIDPYTERCFDVRLDLLRNSGPEAFVRAQPIFLYPANWIATHAGSLAKEAKLQLAHFPGAANVEKRIVAARAFDLWFDMPDADILAIATEDDMLVPSECSKDIERRLNGAAKLAVMQWGGHACNVTDPDTFNRLVLDFLGE